MKRRLFNHARCFEVDARAGRFTVKPLRAWYLITAVACGSMGIAPWLVARLGPYDLTLGGWIVLLGYCGAALVMAALGLSPGNRLIHMDIQAGEVTVGARFGLGPGHRIPVGAVRFGYRERLMPVGDIVGCRASMAYGAMGELTILETTRDHARLPKRLAYALEEARRKSEAAQLDLAAREIEAAPRLTLRDAGIVMTAFLVGPVWMWLYLA